MNTSHIRLEVDEIKVKDKFVVIIMIILMMGILSGTVVGADLSDNEINLNFQEVALRDAFRALAEIAEMNVITDSSVEGNITVHLSDIPFEDAIKLLAKTNGLDYRIVGDTVLIGQPESLQVNFEQQVTRVFNLKNSEPEEVQESLNNLVDEKAIKVDKRTKSIVVTAYQKDIKKVEEVIEQLDKSKSQIMIEARIEDISYSKLESLGIDWSFSNIVWDNQSNGEGDDKSSEGGFSDIEFGDVNVEYASILKMLEDDGDSTTLASPRISTIDGKEAVINIGEEVPIVEESDEDTKVSFKDVGTILRLTPRVNNNDEITLNIKPEVSNVVEFINGIYPRISTKKVETNVKVKDGETIVIGGLISENEVENMSKVPLLGDIPLFGKMFRNRHSSKEKRELVIFITPKIIEESDIANETKDKEVKDKKADITEGKRDFQLYETSNYSMKVPADWKKEVQDGTTAYAINDEKTGEDRGIFSVVAVDCKGKDRGSIEEGIRRFMSVPLSQEKFKNKEEIILETNEPVSQQFDTVEIDGIDAYGISYQQEEESKTVNVKNLGFYQDGKAFVLIYVTEEGYFDQYYDALDEIVESFRVKQ